MPQLSAIQPHAARARRALRVHRLQLERDVPAMSQGLPKRTYHSEADRVAQESAKKARVGRGFGGGFAELLREAPAEAPFPSVLSSTFAGGPVVVALHAEQKAKLKQPLCYWWQLRHGAQPVGPVESSRLDLAKVDDDVVLVAFVAEVPNSGSAAVLEPDTDGAKVCPGWTARLNIAGPKGPGKELLSIRRPGGVQPGGAWLVGVIARGGPEGWQADAIDERYPANRISALLPLRCKDILPPPPAEALLQESPADATCRVLEEAMKEGF